MKQKISFFPLSWDLDHLFKGGSQSPALHAAIENVKNQIQQITDQRKLSFDLKRDILQFEKLQGLLHDLQEFVRCLSAQNVEDQKAIKLNNEIHSLKAGCDALEDEIIVSLAVLAEDRFLELLKEPDLQEIAFNLKEKRQNAKEKLPLEQERLVHQLWIDGYQGWNDLYETFIGQVRIQSPLKETEWLSVGQAYNRLNHFDPDVRKGWFKQWENVWDSHENIVAQILNHIAGFRLNLYQARGWTSVLHEPLLYNRMQESTLNSMWSVVDRHKTCLQHYLTAKAKLMGMDRLAWQDVEAPLPIESSDFISYQDAAHLIIQHFATFSPSMGNFAEQAFRKKWIEAEDRPGKQPGGFCVSFTEKQESRIFMTYSGTMSNVFTLAHELGHAYHSYEVRNQPFFSQQYRMNVAETASTLAEMIMIDSMLQTTKDPQKQLILLDNKLQRAVLFLMNIQARFLFELDFYKARSQGFVLPETLNNLMEKGQKKAFGNALLTWHPHFWAAKQHFYSTDVPFYNFPYTFGYLFSQGIYAALKGNRHAEKTYISLLRDTGRLTVEDLAALHLDVNLSEHPFWESALDLVEKDVSSYIKLASSMDLK